MELIKQDNVFDFNKLRIGNLYIIKDIKNNNEAICMLSSITYDHLTFLYPLGDNYTAVYDIHISSYGIQHEIEEYHKFNEWFNKIINITDKKENAK
jgi:hypothetical protein